MNMVPAGRYIVAVSGGLDSMCLLHMLLQQPQVELIVAHVDHGMRATSVRDALFVQQFAQKYALPYELEQLSLGANASEQAARQARYSFLRRCRKKYNAAAIITAHHRDDLIETAILAIMRGTGWRGLAPFTTVSDVMRPLLDLTKNQLLGYARTHAIVWQEDESNANQAYTRNYIRHTIISILNQKSGNWEEVFLRHIRKQQHLRPFINAELDQFIQKNNTTPYKKFSRYWLIMTPMPMAYESLQHVFSNVTGNTLPRMLAEQALVFVKTGVPYKVMQLGATWQLRLTRKHFIVEHRQSMLSYNKQ